MSFGAYPDVSLRLARDRRDDARKLLAQGEDPGELRKAHRLARSEAPKNTFEAVGREWMKTRGCKWVIAYSTKVESSLRRHAFRTILKTSVIRFRLHAS